MKMKGKRQSRITLTLNSVFSSKNIMLSTLFLKYLMSFPFVELHLLSLQHSFLLSWKIFYCIHSSPFFKNTNFLQNWFLFHFFFYIFSLIFFPRFTFVWFLPTYLWCACSNWTLMVTCALSELLSIYSL